MSTLLILTVCNMFTPAGHHALQDGAQHPQTPDPALGRAPGGRACCGAEQGKPGPSAGLPLPKPWMSALSRQKDCLMPQTPTYLAQPVSYSMIFASCLSKQKDNFMPQVTACSKQPAQQLFTERHWGHVCISFSTAEAVLNSCNTLAGASL